MNAKLMTTVASAILAMTLATAGAPRAGHATAHAPAAGPCGPAPVRRAPVPSVSRQSIRSARSARSAGSRIHRLVQHGSTVARTDRIARRHRLEVGD